MKTVTLLEEELLGVKLKFGKGEITVSSLCSFCLNPVELRLKREDFVPNKVYTKSCTGVMHNNPANSKFALNAQAISREPDAPNWISAITGTATSGEGESFGL